MGAAAFAAGLSIAWLLIFHWFVCLLLGGAIVAIGLSHQVLWHDSREGRGFDQWFKDAAGLAVVGLAGLLIMKVIASCRPQLLG